MRRLHFFVIPFLLCAPVSASADLSAVEQRIAAEVDAGVAHAVDLLERTVNINSGTMNSEGVRETGRLFEPEFAALGFDVAWIDGAAWNRAGHFVARRHPEGAAVRVLLIGHLDTVFEKDSPFQRYERITDTRVKGPGTSDMKGGNIVALLALKALKAAGELDRIAVTVMLIGDEEKAGTPYALSRKDLREAAEWADVAIGFESGDDDPKTAVVSRRGASMWTLVTSGSPYHSSQIFREDIGSGAIYEAARILTAFHDTLSAEALLTGNPGLIVGGTTITHDDAQNRGTAFGKNNVIAESLYTAGDLRAVSTEQRERAKAAMLRIVGRNLPRTTAAITFDDAYPPLSPSDGNRKLLGIFDGASRDLGFGPVTAVDPARAGAADISFTEGLVEMAMDGVGLMGEGGHTVNEYADLTTLPMNAKRVAVTLLRLAAGR